MGKILMVIGIIIVVVGAIIHFSGNIPWLGKLPGDIAIKREGYQFYFPIVTCIVLSIVLSLVIYIIQKIKG